MDYQDYYQTLGLARNASRADIKKAFRRLARENHPDKKPGDAAAERRFKQISEAHAVLADPDKRKKYDMLGANWNAFSQAPPGASGGAGAGPFGAGGFSGFGRGASGQAGNVRYEFRTSGGGGGEFSDFFRVFFAGEDDATPADRARGRSAQGGPTFEEILAQMGLDDASSRGGPGAGGPSSRAQSGARAAGTAHRPPTATSEAIAEIGLEEAFYGTTRRVEIDGRRLEVTIPRGADTGTRVKISGQGPGGGDLVVVIRVRPGPVFTRRGADLERELPITLEEALLGAEVPVTTLKGRVLLRIPPGTQNGRVFRLKGQGMPHLRGTDSGDILAKVRVVLPGALEGDAESAARAFLAHVEQPDPRS